ncbi:MULTISPECIES: hypothetical protein [unclassified Rhizobium]|uniref:hypothetical protein n=1 Tax=unclassified Rhizobium TaxID=2613769 RepID=UPI000715DB72|nr:MULTISPECIES: hypothetical protein [unclassified Rhizobium]KQS93817.1 hypothetical protein ASG50_06815 [Rhizobium sp. Leaf386]KQT06667.1 hypothetical protein ASG42_03570 [Rhizobium sp. Leaf391]KQU05096.1 hypothetical protein ASG68_26430 [Rhizobium sp. Leaf453]
MRRLIVAAALATISLTSFANASQGEGRQRYNDYYYKSYDTAYEPVCVVRKVRSTDDEGNTVVKKVRICR